MYMCVYVHVHIYTMYMYSNFYNKITHVHVCMRVHVCIHVHAAYAFVHSYMYMYILHTSFHVQCTQDSCRPEAVEVKSALHHYTSNIRALRRERREREATKYTLLQAILRSVGLLTWCV